MLDSLTKGYIVRHPVSAARTLSRLGRDDIREMLEALPANLAADVLDNMQPATVCDCLADMEVDKSQDLFNRMNAANAVAAMRLLDKTKQAQIFSAMPRSSAAQLRMRMRLSESVIGSYADADVITFSPDHRVSDALRLFRESRSQQTGHAIYVTDANKKLLGQVELGELLATKESSTIQRLLRPAPAVLNARAALQSSARHPAWVTQDNLPVADRRGLFQGVLWRSTLSDHEQQIINEVADENETATTRSALADIFWLGVGAVFTRNPDLSSQDREEK